MSVAGPERLVAKLEGIVTQAPERVETLRLRCSGTHMESLERPGNFILRSLCADVICKSRSGRPGVVGVVWLGEAEGKRVGLGGGERIQTITIVCWSHALSCRAGGFGGEAACVVLCRECVLAELVGSCLTCSTGFSRQLEVWVGRGTGLE